MTDRQSDTAASGRGDTADRTSARPVGTRAKQRFFGVDVARGIALISMLAANIYIYDMFDDDGTPTIPAMTVTGRSALEEFESAPTLGDPFLHPVALAIDLLVTGTFPAAVYMAYICAGLAIGRLDLTSTRVAAWLFGGGLAMAVTGWVTSSVLLFHMGGLQHLHAAAASEPDPAMTTNVILWDPDQVTSWWWLAVRAPHSVTPIDALHTLGSAMAVLGAVLLLTRLAPARRLLRRVALAGSMTLTIYSAHVLVLATDLPNDYPFTLFVLIVAVALAFAVLWHRFKGQGPLERLVAMAAGRARLMMTPSRTDEGESGRCGPSSVTERPLAG